MQCVSNGEDLKFLLQSKQCHGKLAKTSVGMFVGVLKRVNLNYLRYICCTYL